MSMKQATIKRVLASSAAAIGIIGLSSPAAFAMSSNYGSSYSSHKVNYSACPMVRYGDSDGDEWGNNGGNWGMHNNNCMPMNRLDYSSYQNNNKCDNGNNSYIYGYGYSPGSNNRSYTSSNRYY